MVLLCLEDVSQQRLAENRVREQAALLDITQDAIVVIDLDEIITYWNRGAERVYGWAAAEAVGRNMSDLFPSIEERERSTMKRVVYGSGEWSGELRRTDRAGKALWIRRRLNVLRNSSGESAGLLIVDTDTTEAKRLEEQYLRAQRMESLGSLAGGVAHDLNNIFAPICYRLRCFGISRMRHAIKRWWNC